MFWVILDFQCVGMKICYIDYNIVHKAQVHLSWSKCKPVFPTNKIQLSVAGHGKVQVKLKKIPRWQKFSLEEDAWKNMTGFRSFCNIIMVVLFGSRWRQVVYLFLRTLLVDFTWYDDGDWLRLRRDSFHWTSGRGGGLTTIPLLVLLGLDSVSTLCELLKHQWPVHTKRIRFPFKNLFVTTIVLMKHLDKKSNKKLRKIVKFGMQNYYFTRLTTWLWYEVSVNFSIVCFFFRTWKTTGTHSWRLKTLQQTGLL